MVACKMPAGILWVVQVNSLIQVLAGRGPLEGIERQVIRRHEQGMGGGTCAVLKESQMPSQTLGAKPQQAAAVTLSAHFVNLALIQRSWVPVNPRMVLVRQSSTKAIPVSLSSLFQRDGKITSAEDKHTGRYLHRLFAE